MLLELLFTGKLHTQIDSEITSPVVFSYKMCLKVLMAKNKCSTALKRIQI